MSSRDRGCSGGGDRDRDRDRGRSRGRACNWTKARLFNDSQIAHDTPFICDGVLKEYCSIDVSEKIDLVGVGFLGPIASSGLYDIRVEPMVWATKYDEEPLNQVTGRNPDDYDNDDGEEEYTDPDLELDPLTRVINAVNNIQAKPEIWKNKHRFSCGVFEKRIFAKERSIFHFMFDRPILITPQPTQVNSDVIIYCSLKGPDAQSLSLGSMDYSCFQREHHGTIFECYWRNNPLVELLVKKV